VVAFCLLALCICAGLVTDFGLAYVNKRQAQTAADAAVLAAGGVFAGQAGNCASLTGNTDLMRSANDAADQLRLENLPGSPDADLESSCATGTLTLDYHVNINSPLAFGQMVMNTDHVNVDREAQVTLRAVAKTVGACALCFLGTEQVDTGNADYTVTGANIHINGNLTAGPNGVWTVSAPGGQIGASGTVRGGQFSPSWTPAPVIPDPLASMPLPLTTTGLTAKSNPCTDGPGIYGDFAFPKSVCTLKQGAYVVTGKWGMKNNSTLTSGGSGVTLYFKSPDGVLDAKNGTIDNLTAPTGPPSGAPPGWPSGFAIIYDRDNTNGISAQGNNSTTVTGGIYGKSATLEFNGTSDFHFVGGPMVVKGGTGNGNQGTVFVDGAVNVGGNQRISAGGTEMTK